MEENTKTERTHPLALIAFKFAWAAILVALAAPTALEWGLKPRGFFSALALLCILMVVAASPLLVAYAACERNFRALRTLSRLSPLRTWIVRRTR
jgi:hypothetical protein